VDGVDRIDPELRERIPLEDVERQQHRDALAVGSVLVDPDPVAVVDRDGVDEGGLEPGEILPRQVAAALVRNGDDRFGERPPIEVVAGGLDRRGAVWQGTVVGGREGFEGGRHRLLADGVALHREDALWRVDGGGGRRGQDPVGLLHQPGRHLGADRTPSRASRIAGASTWPRARRPCRSSQIIQPSQAPGTMAWWIPAWSTLAW
jgi:hypothetical protein